MKTPVEDVLAFHRKFGQETARLLGWPPHEVFALRVDLVREEYTELMASLGITEGGGELCYNPSKKNMVQTADAIVDLIYVLVGMALAFGIDLRPVWDEVHHANMAKEGGGVRSDGKVLKPEGWKPPDIAAALARGKL